VERIHADMLYNSCLIALLVVRKSMLVRIPSPNLSFADLSRCAGRISCVAVTSFRGELYGGFMSALRRGQVLKSFLNATPSSEGMFRRVAYSRKKREKRRERRHAAA